MTDERFFLCGVRPSMADCQEVHVADSLMRGQRPCYTPSVLDPLQEVRSNTIAYIDMVLYCSP